jgi:hypothetical protein
LQERVARHEIDLVEQQHPAGVPGSQHELRREAEALVGEVDRLDRADRVQAGLPELPQFSANFTDLDRIASPERDDPIQ